MIWLSWRQQRAETFLALGILALLAALLVPTGLNMADAYHHDGIAVCLSANPGPACADAIGGFRQHFRSLSDLANWFTLIPGLIGVLLAAPFVSDLEHCTYRLAWTQSITRRRWLLGRLVLPIVVAGLASGGLIVLFTWWRSPMAHLDGRIENGIYDTTGTVVIGYTLFALGLALALGALWRRVAASMTVAFVTYFFVTYFAVCVISHAVYQPVSDFWILQLTETALFAGLALLFIAFAAWRVLRAD
jgi:hypothetical protein